MSPLDLKRMLDLPQPERIRTFERWLKHIGLTRSQIAASIAHMKKEFADDNK